MLKQTNILVDFANVCNWWAIRSPSKPIVARRIGELAENVVRALSTSDMENSNTVAEYRLRFYDAWFDAEGNGTNLHQMTRGICRDDFPYRIRSARVYAQVVECVSALPGLRLLNTLRTEKGFGRMKYKFNNEPPPNCISPENCCVSIVKHWLSKHECPHSTAHDAATPMECKVSAEEICSRTHQKLVDTSIVADAIHMAHEGGSVVIYSNDEDMIPGLVTAAAFRKGEIVWLTRSEEPRPFYQNILVTSGVRHVSTRSHD